MIEMKLDKTVCEGHVEGKTLDIMMEAYNGYKTLFMETSRLNSISAVAVVIAFMEWLRKIDLDKPVDSETESATIIDLRNLRNIKRENEEE